MLQFAVPTFFENFFLSLYHFPEASSMQLVSRAGFFNLLTLALLFRGLCLEFGYFCGDFGVEAGQFSEFDLEVSLNHKTVNHKAMNLQVPCVCL